MITSSNGCNEQGSRQNAQGKSSDSWLMADVIAKLMHAAEVAEAAARATTRVAGGGARQPSSSTEELHACR